MKNSNSDIITVQRQQLEAIIDRDMQIVFRIADNIKYNIPFSDWNSTDRKVLLLAITFPERKRHHIKIKGYTYEEEKTINLIKHLVYDVNSSDAYILYDIAENEVLEEDKTNLMTAAERLRAQLPKRCNPHQFIIE